MAKHIKQILTVALVLGVLFSMAACLNPIGFDPDFSLNVNVSGEMDVYNANNAVAWVINRTKTVDITLLRIDVVDTNGNVIVSQPAGYPLNIPDAPKAAHSHASYHKPAKDKYSQPYHYRFTITTRSNKIPADPGDEKEFSLNKYLPSPRDYGLFLIRRIDPNDPNGPGILDFIDEEPPVSELKEEDTVNPPMPPPPSVARYPLIVRNVTKSADVKEVIFNMGTSAEMPFAQEVVANLNDQKSFYLPADEYAPTAIKYMINATGDVRNTKTVGASPRVEVINPERQDAQSWHLLFLYFYKSKDGSYKITQQWPPELNDQDLEDTITGNYTDTRVRVLNKVTNTYVTSISVTKDYATFYTVNSGDFSPTGVIGPGYDWNNHSKAAIFEPNTVSGIGPFVGETYDVILRLTDERQTGRHGEVYIKRKAVNLWLGNTYNIIISKDDVKEGEDVIVIPPPLVDYRLKTNGGPPAASNDAAYTSTEVTATFTSSVTSANLVFVSSTAAGLSSITFTRQSDKVYTAQIGGQTSGGILVVKDTSPASANIDSGDHSVEIFKQDEPPPIVLPPPVGKIILYGPREELSATLFGGDPSTLSFDKNKTTLFAGFFLPPGYSSGAAYALAGMPGSATVQAAANYAHFDIIGTGATLVNNAGGATLGTGTHWERNGDSTVTAAIKVTASSGSFQLKATIPADRNNGTEVSKTVTVNIQ